MNRVPGSAARIDAHHHLWRYTSEEFGWIEDSMAAIRRDFFAEELVEVLMAAHVDAAIAVQARQSVEETEFLLRVASKTPRIAGVVGWLPIAAPNFGAYIDRFGTSTRLKGLRHVVQGEPAGFLDRPDFNRGIAQIGEAGWTYDLLIHAGQLQETARFVDRCPNQSFVLDHIAKPAIASGELRPWAKDISALAERPNVVCKVSGMVTEAGPMWTADTLRPFFEIVLEAFTPSRLLIGSDWPVLTATCSYSLWWSIVEEWVRPLSKTEQDGILGENARRVYHLASPVKDTF